MTTFDDRERRFEAEFTHDQDLRFRVNARRNRLLGEWAAAQMSLTGPAVADYARSVVEADFQKPGDSDVVEKVLADLTAHGARIDERTVRAQLDVCLEAAKKQIMAE